MAVERFMDHDLLALPMAQAAADQAERFVDPDVLHTEAEADGTGTGAGAGPASASAFAFCARGFIHATVLRRPEAR
jgi:hypothetical protein